MENIFKNIKNIIIFVLVVVLGLVLYNVKSNENNFDENENYLATSEDSDFSNKDKDEDENEEIYVHISGAVNKPGLIKLKNGDRLVDAISLAGGARDDADLDSCNLAKKLSDEDKIYIKTFDESADNNFNADSSTDKAISSNNLINLNSASKDELMKIPGVGSKTADKIIDYREKFQFKSVEDLKNVDGIGDKKFEKLKDYLCVN